MTEIYAGGALVKNRFPIARICSFIRPYIEPVWTPIKPYCTYALLCIAKAIVVAMVLIYIAAPSIALLAGHYWYGDMAGFYYVGAGWMLFDLYVIYAFVRNMH